MEALAHFAGAGALGNLRGAGALRSAGRLGSAGDAEVLAGSEALVLAGSDTDVLDGAVEAGALEEEESVPQATRDSAISAATARTRTFFIVKTSIFSILYTASPARAAECCARAFVKAVSDYSIFCVKDKMFFVHFNEL